jgi:hypothetical protein
MAEMQSHLKLPAKYLEALPMTKGLSSLSPRYDALETEMVFPSNDGSQVRQEIIGKKSGQVFPITPGSQKVKIIAYLLNNY